MLPLVPVIAVGVSLAIAVNEAIEIRRLRKSYNVSSAAEFKRKYKISLGAYEKLVDVKRMFDKNNVKPKFTINLSKPFVIKRG